MGGTLDLGSDTLLRLSFIHGFVATAGQQFQLIQAGGDVFGQFANVADGGRLLTADGTGSFLVHYGTGQGLVLSDFQAAAVPEPVRATVMGYQGASASIGWIGAAGGPALSSEELLAVRQPIAEALLVANSRDMTPALVGHISTAWGTPDANHATFSIIDIAYMLIMGGIGHCSHSCSYCRLYFRI